MQPERALPRVEGIVHQESVMPRATDPLLRQHTDSLDLHLRQCRNLSDLRLR